MQSFLKSLEFRQVYILVHSNGFPIRIGPCQHGQSNGQYVCSSQYGFSNPFSNSGPSQKVIENKAKFSVFSFVSFIYMYFKSTNIMFKDN